MRLSDHLKQPLSTFRAHLPKFLTGEDMADSSEWDLLSSNESGSDVYWPEGEFDDTASLAESLSFTDGDFGDELGDLAGPEVEDDYARPLTMDDATLIGEDTIETSMLPGAEQTPNEAVEVNPPTESTPESPPSPPTISNSEIMEGVTNVVETAVCTIIDILNTPQMLSESEFVKSVLCEMKLACAKLKDNAHPCPSLVERFNSLISRIVDPEAATTTTEALPPCPKALSGLDLSQRKSEDPDEPSRSGFGTSERDVHCTIPEWRRHPEPTTPISSSAVPRSPKIVQSLRHNFNKIVCQCPSPCCSHPSFFSDTVSPSINSCLKELLLERLQCGCGVCAEANGGNKHKRDNAQKEKVNRRDMVPEVAWKRRPQQVETDYSWKLVKEHLEGCAKPVDDSWEKIQKFLEEVYVGPRYEKEKVSGELNTANTQASAFPMGALYWDPEERQWKKGMMVLG